MAIASNTGALTSFPSSLAGLLWRRILSEKGAVGSLQLHLSIRSCQLTRLGNVRDPHKPKSIQSDQSGSRLGHHLRRSQHRTCRSVILVMRSCALLIVYNYSTMAGAWLDSYFVTTR